MSQLGLPEASLLAGLIREPTTADPAHDPGLARANQTDTLKAMVRDKQITAAEASPRRGSPFLLLRGLAISGQLQSLRHPGDAYFISAVRQELIAKYGEQMVDGGGLRVTTTLDPTLQAEAYNSIYGSNPDALNPAAGEPSGALVSIGDGGVVKALVGGQNYATSTVDLALGTVRRRQRAAGRLDLQGLHAGGAAQGGLLGRVGLSGPARGGPARGQRQRNPVDRHQLRARDHRNRS